VALAAALVLGACGSDGDGSGAATSAATAAPAAGAAPATTATPSDPATTAAAGEPATTAAPVATDAPAEVPELLRFQAPLVGGGELDAATYAGKPVAFWFWAPG
jgi:hypothetical protein